MQFSSEDLFYQVFKAERLLAAVSDHDDWENIGIRIGSNMTPFDLGILGYYVYSLNHVFTAHQKLSKYQMLISDVANFYFKGSRGNIHWYLTTPFSYSSSASKIVKTAIDIEMSLRHRIVQIITQKRITPVSIEFVYRESKLSRRQFHENHFGCKVSYSGQFNKIVYRFDDLNCKLPSYNSLVSRQLETVLNEQLNVVLGQGNTSLMVNRIIHSNIGLLNMSLKNVAMKINMSPRNLQRRLKMEGNTFQSILDQVHKDIAMQQKRSGKTPGEIASLLGYKETNSFLRAWKRWFNGNFSDRLN